MSHNFFQLEKKKYLVKKRLKPGQTEPDLEEFRYDKIQKRLELLKIDSEKFHGRELKVNIVKIINHLKFDERTDLSTSEIDEETAERSAEITDHPDYQLFAGNILASNLEKNNKHLLHINDYVQASIDAVHPEIQNKKNPLLNKKLSKWMLDNADQIYKELKMERNYLFNYKAMKTLIQGGYLMRYRKNGQWIVIETPQHMYMRISLALYLQTNDLNSAFQLYDILSNHEATMASPTMFNAGLKRQQLSSCFLLDMPSDSIPGIYKLSTKMALISKDAGGIGFTLSKIRSKGQFIAGTNGTSNGIVPMLRVYQATAQYVDQGGGKRKGAFAAYLEPWHPDVFDFLDLRKPDGAEDLRCRDLNIALWCPSLFYERCIQAYQPNAPTVYWSLMDPTVCPGLDQVYGKDFDELYTKYENQGLYKKQIDIKILLSAIVVSQYETGQPYLFNKCSVNQKSNQKNIGTIVSSNLCAEIMEVATPNETANCNLASVNLAKFANRQTKQYDLKRLSKVCEIMTQALNMVIDTTRYPTKCTRRSNLRHRPIGLGIQGMMNAFQILNLPYDSQDAQLLNRNIGEVMYYSCLRKSVDLAKEIDPRTGKPVGPYESFKGSPISQGIFSFDMWKDDYEKSPSISFSDLKHLPNPELKDICDWKTLKKDVMENGPRNSLVRANMPTATTSLILGNNEGAEPMFGVITLFDTLNGETVMFNRHLVDDLEDLDIFTPEIIQKIKNNAGLSIQNIDEIPQHIKDVYKTYGELDRKIILHMARDRALFLDQSESLNHYVENKANQLQDLMKRHMYAYKLGLKTLVYYVRTFDTTNKDSEILKPIETKQEELKRLESFGMFSSSKTNASPPSPTTIHTAATTTATKNNEIEQMKKKGLICNRKSGCVSCEG